MAYLVCGAWERYSSVFTLDWVRVSSFECELPPTSGSSDATYLKNS